MKKKVRKIGCITLLVILSIVFTACKNEEENLTKIRNLPFTVISEEKLSDELLTLINEKKNSPFTITYIDMDYLYICVGYGEQETGGYSISLNELYLTSNAIYIDTSLLGPDQLSESMKAPSYPYIVVKTEYIDKTVVFN